MANNEHPKLPAGFGAYEAIQKIAAGRSAEIYRVRHVSKLGHDFALKFWRSVEGETAVLGKEVCHLASLRHPQLVSVVELVELETGLGLVMDYVEGRNLEAIRGTAPRALKKLSLVTAIHIVRSVLIALDFVHSAKDPRGKLLNIVHGNVCARKIMVDLRGELRLLGFGSFGAGTPRTHERQKQSSARRYLAPERLHGEGVPTHAADVYSCGILLWEMLSPLRPGQERMGQRLEASVPPLTEAREFVPEAVQVAYRKATAVDPRDRYTSAMAFAEALDDGLAIYRPRECRRELVKLLRSVREQSKLLTDYT